MDVRRWESKFTSDPSVFKAELSDFSASLHILFPSNVCDIKLFRDYGGLLEGVPFDILPAQRGCRVLLLGVPSFQSLQTILKDREKEIQYYSELKRSDEESNFDRSVLFVFKEQRFADKFFGDWHIQFFDSASTSGPVCYLAFVDKLFVLEAATEEFQSLLPIGSKQIPSCPLCIERIDVSVSGIITSRRGWLCAGSVSSKSCVACSNLGASPLWCSFCSESGKTSSGLWLCLLCGNVGCGRYAKGHAERHSSVSGHRLSLEISTGRIWDYVNDRFVHRRIVSSQGSSVGMILDLPERIDFCSLPAHPQVSFEEDIRELDKTMSEQLKYERSKYEEACTQLRVLGASRVHKEEEFLEEEKIQETQLRKNLDSKISECASLQQQARSLRARVAEKEARLRCVKRENQEISEKLKSERKKKDLYLVPKPRLDELDRLTQQVAELRLKVTAL